jgi:hypothetical protein
MNLFRFSTGIASCESAISCLRFTPFVARCGWSASLLFIFWAALAVEDRNYESVLRGNSKQRN